MRYVRLSLLLAVAVAVAVVVAVPAEAQVCVRCVYRECTSGLTSGYVNCGSNGEKCIQWDTCSNPVSTPGETFEVAERPAPKPWTLAKVEVRPARRDENVRWRLARVEVLPR